MIKRLIDGLPAPSWVKNYRRDDLNGDVIAGFTVGMMLIPQAMSYALLAGLPYYTGLYASILPLIVYALFGTSRQLAVGPVAMIALLVASGVAPLAGDDASLYVTLAITLSLMVGLIQLSMGIFRLGFLTNFLSHPVISGFTSAAALIIGFSQLKNIVGLELPRTENIAVIIWQTATQITSVNLTALTIGTLGIVFIMSIKKLSPLLPGAMVGVAIATMAVYWLDLDVAVVGEVPAGLPEFALPSLNWSNIQALLPIAITISFVAFTESIAVAKKMAAEKRYEIEPNQELVALGLSNIVASFFKAMPVTGGFSRTAANNDAGANTGMASIVAALLIALALLFLTPLFYYIPKAVLASVVMVAVFGLVDVQEVRHLWKLKRDDLAILAFTFFATLMLGIKIGIFLAIGVNMLWFIIKTTQPHYAVLGRLPNTDVYLNIKRYPNAETTEGILAIRFDAQFYYGNVTFLKQTLKREESRMTAPLKGVVLDATSVNQLDSSADTALHEVLRDYQERHVHLYLAGVKGPVQDVLERSGFTKQIGAGYMFMTVGEAMQAAMAQT
ncbi:MAG: SulP family inorganic anion transporter [Saccharospirillum sp.]